MPIGWDDCTPGTSFWIEEFTFIYTDHTIQAAPEQKTERQVCAWGGGASGGRASRGPGRGKDTAQGFPVIELCSPTHSFCFTGKIIRKTSLKAGLLRQEFYLTLTKRVQQHVSPSVTSITAASASENPDASQELRAHIQSFCRGPPKENSSLHPLHDIAGWT